MATTTRESATGSTPAARPQADEQFARLFGPRALVDVNTAQRFADVLLYIRQFHSDADPIALAETVRTQP